MTRSDDTGAHEVTVVAFDPPPDSEACALRVALVRLQQDNYALQKALSRATEDRDRWRDSYIKATTREIL